MYRYTFCLFLYPVSILCGYVCVYPVVILSLSYRYVCVYPVVILSVSYTYICLWLSCQYPIDMFVFDLYL